MARPARRPSPSAPHTEATLSAPAAAPPSLLPAFAHHAPPPPALAATPRQSVAVTRRAGPPITASAPRAHDTPRLASKGKRHLVARARGQGRAACAHTRHFARVTSLARPRSRKKQTLLAATRRTGALVCGAALSAAAESSDHPYSLTVVGAKPRAGVATRAERVRGAVTAAKTTSAPLARTAPAQRACTRRRRRGAGVASGRDRLQRR